MSPGKVDLLEEGGFKAIYAMNEKYCYHVKLGVSKNSRTPKWMVYNGKPY